MELLIYLFLPFLWLLILLEGIFDTLRELCTRINPEPLPESAGQPAIKSYYTESEQRETPQPPERETLPNDGMNAQERTIPRTPPEPEQENDDYIIIFEPPKRREKGRER